MLYREFQSLWGGLPTGSCFPDHLLHPLVTLCSEGTASLSQKISVPHHLLWIRSPQGELAASSGAAGGLVSHC